MYLNMSCTDNLVFVGSKYISLQKEQRTEKANGRLSCSLNVDIKRGVVQMATEASQDKLVG